VFSPLIPPIEVSMESDYRRESSIWTVLGLGMVREGSQAQFAVAGQATCGPSDGRRRRPGRQRLRDRADDDAQGFARHRVSRAADNPAREDEVFEVDDREVVIREH
jgi:hypothetical protein